MGPLSGYKVIEIASIGPIPMCGMLLADLGADVIRIDRLDEVDLGLKRDPRYEITSRGKRSIAVDLKRKEGADTVLELLTKADVLIEGFRPGVMERLGLGPEVCFKASPELIYGRLTGWGQTGPLARSVGHDMNFIGLTGALDAIGMNGGPPVPPLNLLGDLAAGSLFMAYGIAAALASPGGRARGQVVDLAILDGVASLMATIHGQSISGAWPEGRGTHLLGGATPWNAVYETKDQRFVTVCAIEQRFYDTLLRTLQLSQQHIPDRENPSDWSKLRRIFRDTFLCRTRDEWTKLFEGTDACVAPVLSVEEARDCPHALARESFPSLFGKRQPAPAPRYSKTPARVRGDTIHARGANSLDVLREHGFDSDRIEKLLQSGAVGAPDIDARSAPECRY